MDNTKQPTTPELIDYLRRGGDPHTWKHAWGSTPMKMVCDRLEALSPQTPNPDAVWTAEKILAREG